MGRKRDRAAETPERRRLRTLINTAFLASTLLSGEAHSHRGRAHKRSEWSVLPNRVRIPVSPYHSLLDTKATHKDGSSGGGARQGVGEGGWSKSRQGRKAGKAGKGEQQNKVPALECPVVDGRKCGGYGDCDEDTGYCDCYKGYYGADCMDDPLAHVAFDLDCAKMTPSYVAQCIRAVTSGTCTQYRLTWERLCFKTCAALPGVLCTQYSREKWCSHDPDGTCGESLCNQFMNNYCSVAFEDVTTLRKR